MLRSVQRIARFLFAPAAENLLLENARFPIIRMARDIFFDLRIWRTSEISSHKRISFSSIRLDELGSVRSSWSVHICWFLRYLFDHIDVSKVNEGMLKIEFM